MDFLKVLESQDSGGECQESPRVSKSPKSLKECQESQRVPRVSKSPKSLKESQESQRVPRVCKVSRVSEWWCLWCLCFLLFVTLCTVVVFFGPLKSLHCARDLFLAPWCLRYGLLEEVVVTARRTRCECRVVCKSSCACYCRTKQRFGS